MDNWNRFITGVTLVLSFGYQAQSNDAEKVFREAKLYTVKIRATITVPIGDNSKESGMGTGFVVDRARGWIVTNAHVASRSRAILQVSSLSHDYEKASVVYVDPHFDIAILQVPLAKNMVQAPMECEKIVPTGTAVAAFGHPKGDGYIGTRGIISGQNGKVYEAQEFLQTDAPINPGNSGGPLINISARKVVGMNTAGYTNAQNLNFAIPAPRICDVVTMLKKGIDPSPPLLNVSFFKNLDNENTLKIAHVRSHKGFDFHEGDQIVSVVGKTEIPQSEAQLLHLLRGNFENVTLIVKRDGQNMAMTGSFGKLESVGEAQRVICSGLYIGRVKEESFTGVTLESKYSVTFVEPGSVAESVDIGSADFISSINGHAVASLDEVYFELQKSAQAGKTARFVFLRIGSSSSKRFMSYLERELPVENLKMVNISGDVSPALVRQIADTGAK